MIEARHFPDSMQDIVSAIGAAKTLELVKAYGGSTVWVPSPRTLTAEHPVAQLIGLDAAFALTKVVGGAKVQIPFCLAVNNHLRELEILQRKRKGDSVPTIARALNMSERSVWLVLARLRTGGE